MNQTYEDVFENAACGLLILRKDSEGETICIAANTEAERLLGRKGVVGKSWSEVTGTINLSVRFDEEVLSLPSSTVCRVIKKDLGTGDQLFTLLDVTAAWRSKKEIEEFSYLASHDLQEPLRKIISFGERIDRQRNTLSQETGLYLSRMMGATQRMQAMLNGLLAYSRIAYVPETFARADLRHIIHEVFRKTASQNGQPNARITVDELPEIEVIPAYMSQLFEQLFSNTFKFRNLPATTEVSVTGDVDLLKKKIVLKVQDNSIGFENENAEKVFSLFYRLHGRSEYEGAGIGLALCRKIAERHGGAITVHSAPGKGTLFMITLPLLQSNTPDNL